MNTINRIGVYASSSTQVRERFFSESYRLGELMAQAGIELVYGAGAVGLMGAIADGVDSKHGRVVGVIPQFMVDEGWCREPLSERIVTESMHERKATIARMSDAFVALPGGIGTAEELLECMTWKQLGLHVKPIVLLNTDGYYDPLLTWLDKMVEEKMVREVHRQMYAVVSSAEEVIPALRSMKPWDRSVRKIAQI